MKPLQQFQVLYPASMPSDLLGIVRLPSGGHPRSLGVTLIICQSPKHDYTLNTLELSSDTTGTPTTQHLTHSNYTSVRGAGNEVT